MTFPGTALPVRSQLFIGNQWLDFADATLIRDPIRIRRGVPTAGVRPDPSKCNLSLRNPSGDLSPRLPTGPYFGLFGPNTPQRVVLDEAADDFGRTSSNGFGTSSSGHTWATSGGLASAYAVSGGNATIAVSATNSARIAVLDVDLADCDLALTFAPGVVAAGALIQMGAVLRYQDDNNMYQGVLTFDTNGTVTAFIIARKGGVNTILTATDVGYYTASSRWRVDTKICDRSIVMRAWDVVRGEESLTWDVQATDNGDDAILYPGKAGVRLLLASGNTNSLPLTLTTSDLEVLHHRSNGEVPEWPVDWDMSGNDVWTPIEAAGILRRVNKSNEVLSPLRRVGQGTFQVTGGIVNSLGTGLSRRRAVGYWPLEEAETTTVASSGLPGGQPMTVSGSISWSSVSSVVGSAPLPDMMDGTGTLTGTIPVPDTPTGAWTVGAIFTPPTLSSTWTALSWSVGGNNLFDRFELRAKTDSTFELYGFLSTTSTLLASVPFQDLTVRPTFIRVTALGFEADTEYTISTTINTYDNDYQSATYTGLTSTPGYPTQIVAASVAGGGSDTAGLGHVMVWDGQFTILADTGVDVAIPGHAGESGHARLLRLFGQQDLQLIVIGDDSDAMGPQATAGLPELIDDVLAVDKGLLYEARDELACVYQCRRARYNLPATLELTYGSPGHVAPGFKPTDPDRDVVNDLTIQREGGASGRFELRTGRKSVNPPPQGSGRYPRKKTLPLHDDSQPYQHAAWEVNVAAWDEPNYASVNVNMAAAAQFGATTVYDQAKRLDVGGRLTVANPPAWLPPDMIDLHALGLTEQIGGGQKIGAHAWTIGASTVPAGPYTIGTLDTAARDKLQTAGCELMVNRNSSDTGLTVHTTVLPRWKTAGSGLSIPLIMSGETMTATAIANVSPSFVAVGTAVHGNNASLTPGLPAGLAAGDLLLLRAVIRNSGTGFPIAPDDDWDLLLDMGNDCLYGKYAQSGESTPTVDFIAGVTNATTSAQTAAFRGVGLTVHSRATQLNASAQNIAYPAAAITRDNCLLLTCGSKQDDWTTTTPPGTKIADPSSQTGDDQGMTWSYTIQTTATPRASGSITVTGGGSTISRSGVLALASDVQTMTVTRSSIGAAKAQSARELIRGYQSLRLGL